ncbi:MAG: glycerol-3-phosphate acyltransferase [Chloroflexi bacterium]|nr:glycerol-3-phosphate acyltransferase [Chloroflexota bacterium]
MQLLIDAGVILLAYIFGSIPFGLLIVKLTTGQDVRKIASGRTGGTNVMRAAGCWAGLATALFDILKGAGAVWVARAVTNNIWIEVLAPIAAVLGHNYSIFLAEHNVNGKIRLRGGAGGATAAGGAIGLQWSVLFGLPIPIFMFFGVGYASLTTLSISLTAILLFTVLYLLGRAPWQYIIYGGATLLILLWALRPNIRALIEGRERFHGWRPWKKKEVEKTKDAEPSRETKQDNMVEAQRKKASSKKNKRSNMTAKKKEKQRR